MKGLWKLSCCNIFNSSATPRRCRLVDHGTTVCRKFNYTLQHKQWSSWSWWCSFSVL